MTGFEEWMTLIGVTSGAVIAVSTLITMLYRRMAKPLYALSELIEAQLVENGGTSLVDRVATQGRAIRRIENDLMKARVDIGGIEEVIDRAQKYIVQRAEMRLNSVESKVVHKLDTIEEKVESEHGALPRPPSRREGSDTPGTE